MALGRANRTGPNQPSPPGLLVHRIPLCQPAMSKAASAINGLSVTELVDGVKVYNLTSGKSLPNFLTDRQKRKLRKTDEYRGRVELIQDFEFPTASSCIQTPRLGGTSSVPACTHR